MNVLCNGPESVSDARRSHRLLKLLRQSAGPHTKLLIGDMLLPYACDASGEGGEEAVPGAGAGFVPPGSPLLPNLGKANVHGYLIDVMVRPARGRVLGWGGDGLG